MPEKYTFPKYPEAFRIVYPDLNIQPDKHYLAGPEVRELFRGDVVLEEKLDGSTLFITWTGGKPLLRAKGTRIISEFERTKAFVHAYNWAYQNCKKLEKIPRGHAIVGEWLYALHSIPYNELPDFFVAFDVMHIRTGKLLPVKQRLKIFEECGLASAPVLYEGRLSYEEVPEFVRLSSFSGRHENCSPPLMEAQIMEGIVIKSYGQEFKSGKYVTKEFSAAMEQHWLELPLVQNQLMAWKSI